MPIAKAGDIELSYERAGSGPPLLLIMGMSGTSQHWGEPFVGLLREHFDTIVYDHRGVGESTRVSEPFTIAELAVDAVALLDALEVEAAHVLGISMGGMVAQELALEHPERVSSLVLGCTYCGGEGSALAREEVLRMLADSMASGDRGRAIQTAWRANVSRRYAADEAAYARFEQIGLAHRVAIPVVMEQVKAIGRHDTSARLGELEVPTLVIHGTEDEMLPVANGRMIAELVPDARLEIMQDVGHLFFWEQPQRSAELVREHAAIRAA